MDNNSILNSETIRTFNAWMAETYHITPAMISETYNLPVEKLYYAILNWRDTEASSKAIINTLPVWFIKALNQYAKTTAKYSNTTNTLNNDDNAVESRQYIFNLLERRASTAKANATGGMDIQFDILNSIKIPVPEGFDGNLAYVKLVVPQEVISALHLRRADSTGTSINRSATLIHPLLRATPTYFEGPDSYVQGIDVNDGATQGAHDGGWGDSLVPTWGTPSYTDENSLTSQLHGNYRVHPILFYTNYVEKQNITIDVTKNQKEITITVDCADFMYPFASTTGTYEATEEYVMPKIMALITYYKYGVM